MRNLKRALSLALASVMLLGMMVTGAGAASFPDVEETHNVEAIEVLQAVDVMIGDENGNFGPNDPVNRAQMAVIMAKLLKLNYDYYQGADPGFWDVPSWAAPYVAACHANGIVSGYGDGQYGSGDGVTAVQAASMMMRALGYFKYAEDYKDGFELVTVHQGSEIGIFDGVGSGAGKGLTRNEVARMALNALESEMVTFTGTPGVTVGDVTVGYRAEYTPRTSTEVKYKAIEDRTSDVASDANHKGQYYIQLGEELYNGKLTKKFDRDEFERPSINWQYNGKEIGVYVDYDLKVAEYRTGVTGAALYDELTYTTINDYDLLGFVDGVDSGLEKNNLVRSNKNNVNKSGTGVLTEVFVDQFRDEITVTSINTWLAKANSDYNKSSESLSLKVYNNSTYDSTGNRKNVSSVTKIVDSAVVPEAADVTKDEFRLVYMSGKENAANPEVVRMFDVEILSDTAVSKFSIDGDPGNGKKVVGKLTAGGNEYDTNAKAFYDYGGVLYEYNETLLTDMSYNIYLDRYGNAIGVDLHEGAKNYVFITGYDRLGSNISVRTADAAAIFMDGTMDTIKVNVTDTNKNIKKSTNGLFEEWKNWNADDKGFNGKRNENRWYTYTVSNNGTYTLRPVERMFWTDYAELNDESKTEKVLNTANLFVDDSKTAPTSYVNQGRAYGNDNSVYITVEADKVDTSTITKPDGTTSTYLNAITDVKGVYSGAQNVKIELTKHDKYDVEEAYVYTVYDSNYYIVASVVLGDAQGASANYAYILSGAKNERVEFEGGSRANGDATYYWEFDAVLNGEKQTLTAKTKYSSAIAGLDKHHVQELRFDGDYVTKVEDVKDEKVMKVNDKAVTDKMDVYDVGHVTADVAALEGGDFQTDTHGARNEDQKAYGYSAHRINGTIELVGRTLYTERDRGDVGLALANNAKAVLVQYENGERQAIVCGSVSEAVGRLADARPNNNTDPGTQFIGRIVAVLNSAGAAEWVVIVSDTELRTNDPGYGTGKYNLDLFGDLGNTNYIYPTTVTATLNGVSTVITGTPIFDRDSDGNIGYGAGTRYQIQSGSLVTIQDIDIEDGKVIASNLTSGVVEDGYNGSITRNNRNNTLTIDRMGRHVVIVTGRNPFEPAPEVPVDSVNVGGNVTVKTADGNTIVTGSTGLKVGDILTIVAGDGYSLKETTGLKLVAGDRYQIIGTTIVISTEKDDVGGNDGTPLPESEINMNQKAEDAGFEGKITASVKNGRITVKGLDADERLKAFVVKNGAKIAETTEDGTMDWPEDAELWVLMGTRKMKPDANGLFIPQLKWDESEAGITAGRKMMARAAEGPRPYEFISRYEGYVKVNIGNTAFALEQVKIKYLDNGEVGLGFKCLRRDIAAVGNAIDKTEEEDFDSVDWDENTVPVELPNSTEVVSIPLKEDGEMALIVEYEAGTGDDEKGAVLTIKADPKSEEIYEINGEVVTPEGMTPTEGGEVNELDENDPLVTGLPFTLSVRKGTETANGVSGTKAEAIQKDIAVTYNKETETFTVTGELIYNKGLNDWSTTATDKWNEGYFVSLDLDWTKMPGTSKIYITALDKDSADKSKPDIKLAELEAKDGVKKDTILGKVANADGTMLANRQIKVVDTLTDNTTLYTLDFSGLTVPTPELLKFTAVDSKADKLGDKEISEIQSDVKVEVVETSDTERTVKLTGTLHPVLEAWNDFGGSEYNTGYIVALYVDPTATKDPDITVYNPNGKPGIKPSITVKTTLYVRVADLADGTEQAKTKGNAIMYALSGGKRVTYTLDFSGLVLEKRGANDVKLTVKSGTMAAPWSKKDSDFQENVKIERRGDTFVFTGDLKPVKWGEGCWNPGDESGYFVWFDIDASEIVGANAYSVRGTMGGDAAKNHDDFIFRLGDEELKKDEIKNATLYVLTAEHNGEEGETPGTDKILKKYTLDFSGLNLKEVVPFTVSSTADDLPQDLLCDQGTYSVTVDHVKKEIVVEGKLYPITQNTTPRAWSALDDVFGSTDEAGKDKVGYHVTFSFKPSSTYDHFWMRASGVEPKYGSENGKDLKSGDTVDIRVARPAVSDGARGTFEYRLTDKDEWTVYKLNLDGVKWLTSQEYKEPAGE